MQYANFSQDIEPLIRRIIEEKCNLQMPTAIRNDLLTIPVGVSNRHVHLCRADMDILFGEGSEMQPLKELTQKGFYAAKETVVVAGSKGAISGVRLLGPLRAHTQVELLLSDSRKLGISPDIRESGTLEDSPQLTIVGPKGTVLNSYGILVAWRHIHMNTAEARVLGLHDGDYVKVQTLGVREIIFEKVKIRLGEFNTELHLDLDEANGAGVNNGDKVKIIV
jgi:putative phosphotransacetylase